MSSSPSRLFCSIAEREYNATISTIEAGLFAPIFALRSLKANIKRFEQLVLLVNEKVLNELEEIFLSLIDVRKVKGFGNIEEVRLNFCRAAFSCVAARQALFPPDGNLDGSDDPIFVQAIPLAQRNQIRNLDTGAYETFESYVCKLSLRAILDSFVDDYSNFLEDKLDAMLDAMGFGKIDELIEIYVQAIAPFLNELNSLDKFAQCFFETCNFVTTSINKRDDISKKLSVQKTGPGWTYVIDEQIQKVYDKEIEMRVRIGKLRTRIGNISISYKKNDGFIVDPSDIMK